MQTSEELMDPSPRPIVVYDGECPFCRGQVAAIRRRDRWNRFEYVPKQTPGLLDRYPKLGEGDFRSGMRLVMPDGAIHVGADAVYQIARRLPVTRRIAWLYRIPVIHGLSKAIYAWIAANRYRFVQKNCDAACALDEPSR